MNPKLLLSLTLVLSGGLFAGCASEPAVNPSPSKATAQRQVFPPIEDVRTFFSSGSNEWYGHSFREIISPPQVKRIILLEDKNLQNPYFRKASSREIQDYYNRLLDHLEISDEKAGDPFVAAYEGPWPQFAVITKSGDLIYLQACGATGMLIFGHGMTGTRINITGFGRPSGAAKPRLNASHSLPPVEVNYLLDQKPGHLAGRRFGQIIQPDKIKRIVLLEEDDTIFGHFVETPELRDKLLAPYGYDRANRPPPAVAAKVEKQEHQIAYGKLLDRFETSDQKGEMIHLAENEAILAHLTFLADSGRVIYLEIVGVIDSHITGVLIHGPGEGVRINYTVLPPSTQKAFHALCGRWQSALGDTYDFSDDGMYEHWQQPGGNNYLAEALDPEPVPGGILDGHFSVESGNSLVLSQKAGASKTNKFFIEKDRAFNTNHQGKFFHDGYMLTIVSTDGSVSTYELMFK